MANYTVELHEIVESGCNIFDFTYPIYQETHRAELQQRILDHYWLREIGFETVGRFKHQLKVRMNEIMPVYNRLYEVEEKINILQNQKTTFNDTVNGKQNSDDTDLRLHADTPQGTTDITSGSNVSTIDKDKNTNEGTTETKHTGTITAYSGITEAELMRKFKENVIDVDDEIIKDLADLFSLLY